MKSAWMMVMLVGMLLMLTATDQAQAAPVASEQAPIVSGPVAPAAKPAAAPTNCDSNCACSAQCDCGTQCDCGRRCRCGQTCRRTPLRTILRAVRSRICCGFKCCC